MTGGTFNLSLGVNRGRVVLLMSMCVLALSLLSLLANVMWLEHWPGAGMALAIFSVDRESSLAMWWSSLVLAGIGVVTWLVYRQREARGWSDRLAWYALAGGFLFLSADEACMLHERLGGKVQLEGLMHHARWLLVWLPAGTLLALLVLWRLWRSSRRLVLGVALGMIVFVAGAGGVEMLNASYRYKVEQQIHATPAQTMDPGQSFVPNDWRRDRAYYPYVFGTTIEEFLEMIAPVIWLWVLLDKRSVSGESRKPQGKRARHQKSGRELAAPITASA